jgi:hypothetical protein
VYGISPMTSEASSLTDSSRLASAASSRLTPRSLSTTTRSSLRRPAVVTLTDSRSMPSACTTGSATLVMALLSGAAASRAATPAPAVALSAAALPGVALPRPEGALPLRAGERPAARPGRAGT